MADWSMEPQVFIPCNFQQAHWSLESAVWVPGLVPVSCESESTAMTCLEELEGTVVPGSSRGQQMLQNHVKPKPTTTGSQVGEYQKQSSHKLQGKIRLFGKKMYRYPPVIRGLDDQYTVPTVVCIGPYHYDPRGRYGGDLYKAEEAKNQAFRKCIRDSGKTDQEMYNEVALVVNRHRVRSLYDEEAIRGIDKKEFLPMMFLDACLLVQFMIAYSEPDGGMATDDWLSSYFDRNRFDILHDVLLLENQLPWLVVETIMRFIPDIKAHLRGFVSKLQGCLQDRQDLQIRYDVSDAVLSGKLKPPHLLGLFQIYIVGSILDDKDDEEETTEDLKSFSVSANELAEMGITLAPNKTAELSRTDITRSLFRGKLEMAPLSLNHLCASILVNMAALELCLPHHFTVGQLEKYAVCSYLRLLAMLMDRDEDVHELRAKNLLQGGGLTNKEVLNFFSTLQCLRPGSLYYRTLQKIETYSENRRVRVKVHAFLYKNLKTMLVVFSVITGLCGIMGMFISALKKTS